ncbi:MAG: glycosyltransferase [Desulfarculus sp.]|nr:glycosyltransferase [Desulfarculus sp.]
MLRAYFQANGHDGCTWYRLLQPGRALIQAGLARVALSLPGESPDKKAADLDRCEVVFLGRVFGQALLRLVRELHECGKAVVYDADDDYFNISPLNQAYAGLGLEEVQLELPDGRREMLWADLAKADQYPGLPAGRLIDLAENQANAAALRAALAEVDAITVTTEELAQAYRGYGPPVIICPNCIDFELWQPLPLHHDRNRFLVGWAGGSSHYEDLTLIRPALAEAMENEPRMTLSLQGAYPPAILRGLDPERVRTHGWTHPEAHPWRSAALAPDLAVIPLVDNAFNRRKSPIKWLEYAALGVPAICSDLPPYSPVVVHGVNGLLARNTDEWVLMLLELAADPIGRAKLGGRALETARACYDQRTNAPLWLQALETALDRHQRGAARQSGLRQVAP